MERICRSLAVLAVVAFLAACAQPQDKAKPALAGADRERAQVDRSLAAVTPGSTWIAYELRPQGVSLVPSFCAAPPGTPYTKPPFLLNSSVCAIVSQEKTTLVAKLRVPKAEDLQGFNPPGAAGPVTPGTTIEISGGDGDGARIFQLFEVQPGRYFPALIGFEETLATLEGISPYYDIKAGKINYIGSYNVPPGADPKWQPELLRALIAERKSGFDLAEINEERPVKARISCKPPEDRGLLNIVNFAPDICSLAVLEGFFFQED